MSDKSGQAFDLIERPWILAHHRTGAVEEVSLVDLFARAHEFRTVLGDIPTQTFAIVRLLLAILRRVVDGPPSPAEWHALWRDQALPVRDVADYLGAFRHRFDLLSAETPFYQVADLHTARNEGHGLARLIADVPSNSRLFTTRLGEGLARLSFAEAARWLVHCQAFDPSGIKSGAVGDPRVKGGRGYPIGTGWAGSLGGVLVEGRNLRDTLLLQLVPNGLEIVRAEQDDAPVWERAPQGATEEVEGGRPPKGPLDLYTWQSRRIRLFSDADGVHSVLIANGDKLTPQNMFGREPMSAWRRSQAQERKLGTTPVYMPREHDPERSFWRGLAALLPELDSAGGQRIEAASHLRPGVLRWLDHARTNDLLPGDYQLRARAIGMQYGAKDTTTAEVIDDVVSVAVALVSETNRELGAEAVAAVGDAEEGAQALGNLAGNLAEAAGGESTGPRDRAREMAYAALDRPFRAWLAGLGPETDPEQARRQWQVTARDLVASQGDDLVDQAGPAAWRGREVRGRHVSAPEAHLWFRGQLRKVFAMAYPRRESEVAV